MRIAVLGSGSGGNCTYIEGESGAVLLDAGFSAAETLRRLACAGGRQELIRAILVTHEHADHISGLIPLARRLNVPVVATGGTLAFSCPVTNGRVEHLPCRIGETIAIDDFRIECFGTSHDAREPCGFRIAEHDISFAACTDTGLVTPRMLEKLRSCDAILLESNHCPEMLRNGPYPAMLKQRIRSRRGHLSNIAAAECLQTLGAAVPHVMLAHLSEVNNTPGKALATALQALGFYAPEVEVCVSRQSGISTCFVL